MKLKQYRMSTKKAYDLWKIYVKACKDNPDDEYLEDMKKIYNQLKSGRKIVDIFTVFQRAGITDNYEPKLAICQADGTICYCRYSTNGTLMFTKNDISHWGFKITKADTTIRGLPEIPKGTLPGEYNTNKVIKTMVPKIPASLRPQDDLSKYYVLWEVDEWEIVPPRDPYLLRRITDNMYVVLAGWELTELERAVMKGRVW